MSVSKAPRRNGPISGPVGGLFEPVYQAIVQRRNNAFDAGKRVTRLDIPVISVGNLSVGGTGKTPMVMDISRRLREAGRSPAIAMRGYKARRGELSDEQREYLERFPGLPVAASPNRLKAIEDLRAQRPEIDCIILDDGFQNRFIARDLDIVLIDATRSPFQDRCLPAGWLREPVDALARADAVVVTHAELVDSADLAALEAAIRGAHGKPPLAIARHAWTTLLDEQDQPREVGALADCAAYAIAGIGNPDAFFDQVRRNSSRLAGCALAPDHAEYTGADVVRLFDTAEEARADVIITTEKDWVKMAPIVAELRGRRGDDEHLAISIVRPRLSLEFERGEEELGAAARRAAARRPDPSPRAPDVVP